MATEASKRYAERQRYEILEIVENIIKHTGIELLPGSCFYEDLESFRSWNVQVRVWCQENLTPLAIQQLSMNRIRIFRQQLCYAEKAKKILEGISEALEDPYQRSRKSQVSLTLSGILWRSLEREEREAPSGEQDRAFQRDGYYLLLTGENMS